MDKICSCCKQVIQEVTSRIIDDIVVTGIESGLESIGYWGTTDAVFNGEGYDLPFNVYEHESEAVHTMTAEKLEQGIRMAATDDGKTIETWFEQHDAWSASEAFQFALFGELVYG